MELLPSHITTVTQSYEIKFKEKGSLFIGQIFHTEDENDAQVILEGVRKKYFDATHNCYAYRITDGSIKYSDDGEPNGTAGKRILNAINHEKLFNVIIIVTRYFGGTKLGIGPLGNAYYDASIEVIKASTKNELGLYVKAKIRYDFEFSNLIHRLISQHNVKITSNFFEDLPGMEFLIPVETKDSFCREIKEKSLSKLKVEITDQYIYL
ncbi:MAG TPA: YigZ family protein [Melioribacteraceae bacterium]|nr:YigZ family protein [Melioribacteraceae bacterium]